MSPVEKASCTCYVYRSLRKPDTYLYCCKKDDFSEIPEAVLKHFGQHEFALEFEMHPGRKLAQEDSDQVWQHLQEHGFHIQLPRQDIDPEWYN